MTKTTGTFNSSNSPLKIKYYIYEPKGEIKGIVQLSHGMSEYVERYEEFAKFITKQGFIFCGNDHLGHGNTGAIDGTFGTFAKKDGYKYLVEDVHIFTKIMKKKYGKLPFFLFGHSMGSFIARNYLSKYSDELTGCIICGTSGKNPINSLGVVLTKAVSMAKGHTYQYPLLDKMAFGSYNERFTVKTGYEWLSRDEAICQKYIEDPFCNFSFSTSGFRDLMTLLGNCNKKSWYSSFSLTLPLLLISGDEDPVGSYGEGVAQVFLDLKRAQHNDVQLKLYKDARHELLNETNKEEVSHDILNWLEKYI